jgi:hypothetical protein
VLASQLRVTLIDSTLVSIRTVARGTRARAVCAFIAHRAPIAVVTLVGVVRVRAPGVRVALIVRAGVAVVAFARGARLAEALPTTILDRAGI